MFLQSAVQICKPANSKLQTSLEPLTSRRTNTDATPQTGDNQLRFALCSVGQCGHFEPGISSFTLWLCPLLSTTSALTVHQQCPLFTLCTQLTLSSTPIHPAPTPHFGPHINNNNCNYNIPEVVTPVEGLKSPIFALMTAQIRLFSYRNCGIHTSYMQPSIIVQYLGMGHDDGA